MVEYNHLLNSAYSSLSDPTRRDILSRVFQKELSISEIAKPYQMSFAAVAKHVAVLEMAQLVHKRQVGKQQFVQAAPQTIQLLQSNLKEYQQLWINRFRALDKILEHTK